MDHLKYVNRDALGASGKHQERKFVEQFAIFNSPDFNDLTLKQGLGKMYLKNKHSWTL